MKTLVRIAAVLVVGGLALWAIYVGISNQRWLFIVVGFIFLLKTGVVGTLWLKFKY